MNIASLAWRLLRAGGRRGMLGSLLTLVSVTVVTALLLFAIAGNLAFDERGERTSWRIPQQHQAGQGEGDDAKPTAIEASKIDYVHGRRVTVVDLAATGQGTAPVPPGMPHFPAPGEVWVSPALAELIDALPADQLADRFPAAPRGELTDDALVNDSELVAVVGHRPDDAAMTAQRGDPSVAGTPISGFGSPAQAEIYGLYRTLMAIATVLMVVPLLVFGGAAARLTVARRDQRLATLRLIGATPRQVLALTVVEAMITAGIGASAGIVLYLAAMPALARIPIDGGAWYVSDLWPGLGWIAAVLASVPLLVGVSAVAGLRRVVVSPLGVARRHTPPGMRAVRLLVLLVLVAAFLGISVGMFGDLGGLGAAVLLVLLGAVFLAMNYVGPWVISIIGRVTAATARNAATLLAGRRLVDDPRAAWRTVAGIALTGFMAGFMGLMSPSGPVATGTDTILTVAVPDDRADHIAQETRTLLPGASSIETDNIDGKFSMLKVTVRNKRSEADTARTALAPLIPGNVIHSATEETTEQFVDIRTGVMVVLSVSMLIAMVSAAVSGASSVLDRRQTYALLHLSGTPQRVLDRARRKETLIPLVIMGGFSLGVGLLMAVPFLHGGGVSATGALTLAVTAGVGVTGILGASAMSRPLLRSVMHNAAPRPD
jgi:hypothetical protein